jgi:spermidine synthase
MPHAPRVTRGQGLTWTLPALYVLSGAAALILEVTWSRLLTLQFGHTTGATSTVLAAFMGGLAAGAAIGGRIAERGDEKPPYPNPLPKGEGLDLSRKGPGPSTECRKRALRLYAMLEVVVAVSAVILPIVLAAAEPLLAWAYADGAGGWRFGVVRVVVSLVVLAVPTMAMGATYPLAMRALAENIAGGGQAAGRLYAGNTIGAAAGALAAGFVLLPAVGIRMTTLSAVALNVAAAGIAWWLAQGLPASLPQRPADTVSQVAGGGRSDGDADRDAAADGAPELVAPTRSSSRASRGTNVARGAAVGARTRTPSPRRASPRGGAPASAEDTEGAETLWIALIAAAAFGLVALANQVVWTRVIALIVGPTTYAFSAMVGVFIAGLAIGAAGGTRLARGRRAVVWLGVMAMTAGVAIALSIHLTGRLLLWIAVAASTSPGAGAAAGSAAAASGAAASSAASAASTAGVANAFGAIVWRQIAIAAALLGPLSIASGAAFPLALAAASRGGTMLTPLRLSFVYAANTVGAIAGALLAGFVFVPAFGLQTTLRWSALLSVSIGSVVLLAGAGLSRQTAFASRVFAAVASIRGVAALTASAVVAAGVFTLASWDPALMSSGAYRFAPAIASGGDRAELEALLTAGDVLFYDEGSSGTVAVRRLGGTTSLVIDGKPDASNDADMLTQKLLAHLPLLHHERPRRALVLGLGSGVTAGAALTYPLTSLDVVEISPEVVTASNYFRSENLDALADPRTRLLVTDGRSHLRLASSTYDVVISEPSNPWMAGVASLFTREFMTSVRERLASGGIFCQWTHTYDMSRDDLRSIVATFTSVFPHASLWLVGESDVLLIGSVSPLNADDEVFWRRYINPAVRDDLRTVAVSGIRDLLGLRVADAAALRRYAIDAPVQTDDRMALEFSAPRSLADRAGARNAAELLALAAAPPVDATSHSGGAWASRGRMMLRAEAFELAYQALAKAIELGGGDEETMTAFAQAAAGAGKVDAAAALLRAQPAGNIPARVALARILMARGDADGALAAIELLESPHPNPLPKGEGLDFSRKVPSVHSDDAPLRPDDARSRSDEVRLLREQASIFADVGAADRLAPVVELLRQKDPASRDTRYYASALAFMQGDLQSALTQAQALVAAHPDEARAHNLIGAALATRGQADDARAAFARAIAADPRDAAAYVNAGSLDLEQGRPADARRHFAIALTLDASNESARQGLAAARLRLAQR